MRAPAAQQVEQVISQCLIGVHGRFLPLCLRCPISETTWRTVFTFHYAERGNSQDPTLYGEGGSGGAGFGNTTRIRSPEWTRTGWVCSIGFPSTSSQRALTI